MSDRLPIELIKKTYVQPKRGQCVHYLLLLSSHIREISSSIKKICLWKNWLIKKKVYFLTRKSMANNCWTTFSIMEMLGIKSNLETLVTWGYHYMWQHNLNSLFARYRAINTWNGLSGDLCSSSSLCTFKNKLRQLYLSLT